MTSEELQQLKAMSPVERTRKYTPMMLSGKITKNQYDYVMSLGLSDAPQAPVSVSTNHPDPVVGKSQKERVLSVLKRGGWWNTLQISELAYGVDGTTSARVASRIDDLKNDGYKFDRKYVKHNGTRIRAYRLCTETRN